MSGKYSPLWVAQLVCRGAADYCKTSPLWQPWVTAAALFFIGFALHRVITGSWIGPWENLVMLLIYGTLPIIIYFVVFYAVGVFKTMLHMDLASIPDSRWDELRIVPNDVASEPLSEIGGRPEQRRLTLLRHIQIFHLGKNVTEAILRVTNHGGDTIRDVVAQLVFRERESGRELYQVRYAAWRHDGVKKPQRMTFAPGDTFGLELARRTVMPDGEMELLAISRQLDFHAHPQIKRIVGPYQDYLMPLWTQEQSLILEVTFVGVDFFQKEVADIRIKPEGFEVKLR